MRTGKRGIHELLQMRWDGWGIGVGVTCMAGMAVLCAPLWQELGGTAAWLLDLATNWVWGYFALSLWLLAGACYLRRKVLVVCAIAAVSLHGALLFKELQPRVSPAAPSSSILTVGVANVHVSNPDPSRFLAWLEKTSPDIVVVMEVSPKWAAVLEQAGYPHHRIVPRTDSFGIALLSRLPLEALTEDLGHDVPVLRASVRWQGQPVRVVAAHPLPPLSPLYGVMRDQMLGQLAGELAASGEPAILAGDFNATPWSTGFPRGLSRVSGIAPTWPAWLGPLALIPIDHVAASGHWNALSTVRGFDIGSDHFPVSVGLSLSARP